MSTLLTQKVARKRSNVEIVASILHSIEDGPRPATHVLNKKMDWKMSIKYLDLLTTRGLVTVVSESEPEFHEYKKVYGYAKTFLEITDQGRDYLARFTWFESTLSLKEFE